MIRRCVLLITLMQLANPGAASPLQSVTPAETSVGHRATASVVSQSPATLLKQMLLKQTLLTQQLTTLLKVTGITAHLPDIHAMVREARARHMLRCGAAAATSRNTSSYEPQNIQSQLISSLRKTLSPDNLATVLQWYDSDIGKRVVNSEKRARPIESFESTLMQARQSPNWNSRRSLITKVELHTGANRLGAITGIETEHGGLMLSGCIETYRKLLATVDKTELPDSASGNLTNREQLMSQIIRDEKPELEMHHYPDTLDGMTFSLQDVNQSDLTEYADFVASPAARHVFASLVDAMEQTLQNASLTQAEQSAKQNFPEDHNHVARQLE